MKLFFLRFWLLSSASDDQHFFPVLGCVPAQTLTAFPLLGKESCNLYLFKFLLITAYRLPIQIHFQGNTLRVLLDMVYEQAVRKQKP